MIFKTSNYQKQAKQLDKKYRTLLEKQERLLVANIFDSRLHTKKLQGFGVDLVYSFRITSSYRGIFRLTNDQTIVLFAIGHRKDIYQDLN